MNKTYKYTLTAHEKKEISFETGVARLAIANGDGVDGSTIVVMNEITKQHSGDLVSFIDGADAPFADFKVNIEAVQSGSGDPSPTNVRPISGWTGATINVSGEDTSDPTTYNVNWQSTAGTVYGGELNVKTGVLTVTHYMYDLASLSYGATTTATGYKKAYFSANDASRDLTGANMICSHVIGAYNGSGHAVESVCSENAGYIYLQLSDTTLNGLTVKEYVLAQHNNNTPVIVVGKLATPVTYQLTPVEIHSLLGVNNVWADCGSIDIKYFVQSTQPMIDYIDEKTIVYFDAQEDFSTYDISLIDATSTDVKNCLKTNKNANIVIRVKRYSTIELFYLREYSPNYFAEFASHAVIFDAEGTKSMRINYLRLDLTQETSNFTDDHIILPTS